MTNTQNTDQTSKDDSAEVKKDEGKKDPPLNAKEEAAELFKTALIAIVLAILIRSLFYEPFNIPSGSMKPTLLVGDYLFVSKPAYGYSRYSFPFGLAPIEGRVMAKQPQRGDVVVFKLPSDPSVDYIKRIIGMPGDTVQVSEGMLYINNKQVPREFQGRVADVDVYGIETTLTHYIETLPNGASHSIYEETNDGPLDNTPLYTVPNEHYFVMGDNRDHSQDSRVANMVGYVPYENLVGRADFLFFSTNGKAHLLEVWKWPSSIRYNRLFQSLGPTRAAE